jgi:hypothetical protein
MRHVSWRRWLTAPLFNLVVCLVLGGTFAPGGLTHTTQAELDHLIPREKWEGTGLNKLTASEQQTLADEITTLLGAARSTQISAPAAQDRSQWRNLQRYMSKVLHSMGRGGSIPGVRCSGIAAPREVGSVTLGILPRHSLAEIRRFAPQDSGSRAGART